MLDTGKTTKSLSPKQVKEEKVKTQAGDKNTTEGNSECFDSWSELIVFYYFLK